MVKCYFNICDDNWWTVDEYGVCWGIGATPAESIETAEFWGLDCGDVCIFNEGDYVG